MRCYSIQVKQFLFTQRLFLRVLFLVVFFLLLDIFRLGLTDDEVLFPNDGANGLFEPNE